MLRFNTLMCYQVIQVQLYTKKWNLKKCGRTNVNKTTTVLPSQKQMNIIYTNHSCGWLPMHMGSQPQEWFVWSRSQSPPRWLGNLHCKMQVCGTWGGWEGMVLTWADPRSQKLTNIRSACIYVCECMHVYNTGDYTLIYKINSLKVEAGCMK